MKVIWAALRPPARAAIGALLLTGLAHAQTTVSGPIRTNQTWAASGSPYIVDADVAIEAGAVLTIEPGVTVRLGANANLVVSDGALRAEGSAATPIVLTSASDVPSGSPAPGAWGNLTFMEGAASSTRLEWVQVNYGKGIRIQGASPILNYVDIRNSSGAAIQVDLNSSPSGVGLQASGNAVNGISVPAGDITGNVKWNLRGIPYVVASGEVSVGLRPSISSIVPATIQQGETIDAVVTGFRVGGVETASFDAAGVTATLRPGATAATVPIRISATMEQPVGKVSLSLQTSSGLVKFPAGLEVVPFKPTVRVTGLTPSVLRRGESGSFRMDGTYLNGATVTLPANSGLTLSGLQTTETQATFTLAAAADAVSGQRVLQVANPSVPDSTATAALTIIDGAPRINTDPSPISLFPNGKNNTVTIRLSAADLIDNTIALTSSDPTIATVTPASITVPRGQLQATVQVTGLKVGTTLLNMTSATLQPISYQIYVGSVADNTLVDPVLARPVGVVLMKNFEPDGVAIAPPVGVVLLHQGAAPGGVINASPVGVVLLRDLSNSDTTIVSPPVSVELRE
ncbi:hypothetical protein [Pseudoduganella sp. R-34]|uniref:hypothetical protein n=1 Tax=Pseudoduganella sp. R-34 TaxID=3404062 RepID=UPI003CE6E5B6